RRPKSQTAGGASIHKKGAYVRSAAPRQPKARRTGAYIGKNAAIVKARFLTRSGVAMLMDTQFTLAQMTPRWMHCLHSPTVARTYRARGGFQRGFFFNLWVILSNRET